MVLPGRPAPPFSLPADDGTVISLAALAGRKVVLYFYPSDGSETCTAEACAFRDAWARLRRTGATVLGVSPDGASSHARFRARHALPFRLLVDADHALARTWGAWGAKVLFGRRYQGVLRTTFVLDERGWVTHRFDRVRIRGHVEQVLAALGARPSRTRVVRRPPHP